MAGSIDPRGASPTKASEAVPRTFSPLQVLVLRRLAKLLHQRRECQKLVDSADWHLVLVRKAIYSTYCDALTLDLTTEATELLGTGQEQVA